MRKIIHPEEPIATFNRELLIDGCKNLCSAVIKQAIRDKDRYFFESGYYLLFQSFLDNGYDKEDYLKVI